MELGEVQKAWIKSLRDHPERQTIHKLGEKITGTDDYEACCLGEGLCVYNIINKLPLPFDKHGVIRSGIERLVLSEDYQKLGLYNSSGAFKGSIIYKGIDYFSLGHMNDSGVTWPEIADIMKQNSSLIFKESV